MFALVFEACAGKSTLIALDERALSAEGGSTLIAPHDANCTRRLMCWRSNMSLSCLYSFLLLYRKGNSTGRIKSDHVYPIPSYSISASPSIHPSPAARPRSGPGRLARLAGAARLAPSGWRCLARPRGAWVRGGPGWGGGALQKRKFPHGPSLPSEIVDNKPSHIQTNQS